jgi:hypothetical protein
MIRVFNFQILEFPVVGTEIRRIAAGIDPVAHVSPAPAPGQCNDDVYAFRGPVSGRAFLSSSFEVRNSQPAALTLRTLLWHNSASTPLRRMSSLGTS